MKKKIVAVSLSICLLLTLSLSLSVQASSFDLDGYEQFGTTVINETTVKIGENGLVSVDKNEMSDNQIAQENTVVPMSQAAAVPIGFLDVVSITMIGGWAYQSDIPNTALDIHIYLINNSTGHEYVIVTTANGYRPDLEAAGYGNGYHAFHYEMNWKTYVPGTYTVRAYAIGVGSGNPLLTNTKEYTVRDIIGNVDNVSSTNVRGWIWKPDAPNDVIDMHLYIRNSNNEIVATIFVPSDIYRADLEAAGYGNGRHGFDVPIDWSTLPEENLRLTFYAVDNSDFHPTIYEVYYDNRKPIYLIGMMDLSGHDFSVWARQSEVTGYCNNIGCSSLNIRNYADDKFASYERVMRESSYCAIVTHGNKTGIQWSTKAVAHTNAEKFGYYEISDLRLLSNSYFSTTRCVALVACSTAEGGENDPDNFVNVLHKKGVKTVLGFEDEIVFGFYSGTNEVCPDVAAQFWITEFTKQLGNGQTVANAAANATDASINKQLELYGYIRYDFENNLISEDIKNEKILCGLNTYCIVGDKQQVVKH